MNTRHSFVCATLLVMFAGLSGASATTLLKLNMNDLVRLSEDVVRGTVKRVEAKEVDGRIFTYVTLEAKEYLKGEGDKEVTLRVLGGTVGDVVTVVHSTSQFRQGEDVLVFLERPRPGATLVVTGMAQGKFNVSKGPDQKTLYVVPHQGGKVSLVEREVIQLEEGKIRRRLKESTAGALQTEVRSLEAIRQEIKRIEQDAK